MEIAQFQKNAHAHLITLGTIVQYQYAMVGQPMCQTFAAVGESVINQITALVMQKLLDTIVRHSLVMESRIITQQFVVGLENVPE